MNYELPPQLAFGAGALCMLTCVLIVALSFAFVVIHWLWGHASNFTTMGADRERGVVKLRAELQEKKPVQPVARVLTERRNGSGPLSEQPPS